jgi:AcrR family transcriptional regulator
LTAENEKLGKSQEKIPTKQKILECAIDLFAMKGYTETTIRELAAAVDIKEGSIYNHFPSKNSILECIIEEYSELGSADFFQEKLAGLGENPTSEYIISCMNLNFREDKAEHYLKELYVIFQEQHRNPMVRKYVSEGIILQHEHVVKTIIDKLKEFNIIRQDTDPDIWAKLYSSIIYTFASRALLGIGDSSQNFTGAGMVEMMRTVYDMLLKSCAVSEK